MYLDREGLGLRVLGSGSAGYRDWVLRILLFTNLRDGATLQRREERFVQQP